MDLDIEALRTRIRSMAFERGTTEQIAQWRASDVEARANLAIEDMEPTASQDARIAMMLEEGVPPALMIEILTDVHRHKDDQVAA